MTDPVIPLEAVEAAAKALATDVGLVDECGFDDAWRTRTAGFILAAALPHLRPLVEARWAQMYSDAVDNGNELAQELRQDLKVATKLGLELGRQEMLREVLDRLTADGGVNLGAVQRALRGQGGS